VRFVGIEGKFLNLMHLRKGTDNTMSVTIQENLAQAHVIKKPCQLFAQM